jgi:hypothetical protein
MDVAGSDRVGGVGGKKFRSFALQKGVLTYVRRRINNGRNGMNVSAILNGR